MVRFGSKEAPSSIAICTKLRPIGCKSTFPFVVLPLIDETPPARSNGQVALAFQLQDQRLLGQVRSFLDWTLANQGSDGWIGPEAFVANATIPRLVWPRYLVMLGLIVRSALHTSDILLMYMIDLQQYAEADPSQTARIVDAMHRFVALANNIWKTGQQGVPSMGFQFDYQYVRWEEITNLIMLGSQFVYALEWLYDNAPQGPLLLLVVWSKVKY
ncbi:hypothetical protein C0991_004330 [Blastosporella zonata]|nr:hypothetical protein C0991_004330 [Blastosporella zonata]